MGCATGKSLGPDRELTHLTVLPRLENATAWTRVSAPDTNSFRAFAPIADRLKATHR